jgi:MoaA/NifB/PqqE/SkfB family radical SAM enzyme
MVNLSYSQLKPAWHLDRIEALRAGKNPAPVHVQLILSDLCNQDCSFCAYRMSAGLSRELFVTPETHNPNRRIETLRAEEIIRDCAALGVKAIQFTGGGEPTVHKDHERLFALASALGMQTALVTNGVKLKASPAFLGMQWVRVSVDAGDAETYASIRGVSTTHWDAVWRNVAAFAARFTGALGIGFVVTKENWRGIKAAAAMTKAAGASNMRVGAVFSSEGAGYYGGLISSIYEAIAEAKECNGDGFEVIDLFGRRVGDLQDGAPQDPFCGYQYFTTYIGADLNVYRCCNTAYTTRGTIGSLKHSRLGEVLAARGAFDARQCQHCQFLGQNRAISALVQEPTHPAFV